MPMTMTILSFFPLTPSLIILLSNDGITICIMDAITTKPPVAMTCFVFSLILEKISVKSMSLCNSNKRIVISADFRCSAG